MSEGPPRRVSPSDVWHREDETGDRPEVDETEAAPSFNGSLWHKEDLEEAATPATPRVSPATTPDDIWKAASNESRSTTPPPPPPRDVVPQSGSPQDHPSAGAERKRPRRRWKRALGAITLLIVLAFVADAAYVAVRTSTELLSVRDSLGDARSSLNDGDFAAASESVEDASQAADAAASTADHPAYLVGKFLPDGRVLDDATTVGQLAINAADAGIETAEILGIDANGLGADLYADGRVDLDLVRQASPSLTSASADLRAADDLMSELPDPLVAPLGETIDDVGTTLEAAKTSAENADAIFGLMPRFLGGEGERKYLLAFQALGEARGTGGVVGLYGILHANDGTLKLEEIGPYSDFKPLSDTAEIQSPEPWFRASYGPQLALQQWPQANLTPNFPVAAEAMLRMYEDSTGEALDGAIAMDPVALSYLLKATGDIKTKSFPTAIGSANAAEVLMKDSYLEFSESDRQDDFLAELVRKFWSRVSSGGVNSARFIAALGDSARTSHLKFYSRAEDEQRAWERAGIAGDYTTAGDDVQLVFHNNYVATKVDVFLERTIDTKIKLDGDGDARVTTTVSMSNTAPDGPTSLLLGPSPSAKEYDTGVNVMDFNIILPVGATPESWKVGDQETTQPHEFSDSNRTVAWDVVTLGPGEDTTIRLNYFLPGAAEFSGERGEFDFTLEPQTRAIPDRFTLEVAAPAGYAIVDSDDTTFRASGELEQRTSVDLRFERS